MSIDALEVESRVSYDEMVRWFAEGWLSFDPRMTQTFEETHLAELRFLGALLRTGLGTPWVRHILSSLARPYRYHPDRMLYSFARNAWFELPGQRGNEELLKEAVQRCVDAEEVELLACVRDDIDELLEIEGRARSAAAAKLQFSLTSITQTQPPMADTTCRRRVTACRALSSRM